MNQTVAEAMAEELKRAGVDRVFGYTHRARVAIEDIALFHRAVTKRPMWRASWSASSSRASGRLPLAPELLRPRMHGFLIGWPSASCSFAKSCLQRASN